jgi:hypothetical protein
MGRPDAGEFGVDEADSYQSDQGDQQGVFDQILTVVAGPQLSQVDIHRFQYCCSTRSIESPRGTAPGGRVPAEISKLRRAGV